MLNTRFHFNLRHYQYDASSVQTYHLCSGAKCHTFAVVPNALHLEHLCSGAKCTTVRTPLQRCQMTTLRTPLQRCQITTLITPLQRCQMPHLCSGAKCNTSAACQMTTLGTPLQRCQMHYTQNTSAAVPNALHSEHSCSGAKCTTLKTHRRVKVHFVYRGLWNVSLRNNTTEMQRLIPNLFLIRISKTIYSSSTSQI